MDGLCRSLPIVLRQEFPSRHLDSIDVQDGGHGNHPAQRRMDTTRQKSSTLPASFSISALQEASCLVYLHVLSPR